MYYICFPTLNPPWLFNFLKKYCFFNFQDDMNYFLFKWEPWFGSITSTQALSALHIPKLEPKSQELGGTETGLRYVGTEARIFNKTLIEKAA